MHIKSLTDHIRVHGTIKLLSIKNLSFYAEVNHHAKLWIEGYTDHETAGKIENKKMIDEKCSIIDISSPGTIFEGVYQNISLTYQNELIAVKAEVVSGTKRLDFKRKCRSFQNASATYAQVVKEVVSDTPDAAALISDQAETAIGKPLLQYNETDWEFLKRLASMLELSLIPDYQSASPRFSFGEKESKTITIPTTTYVQTVSDKYYADGGEAKGRYKADYLGMAFGEKQYIPLGNKIAFQKQSFRIYGHKGAFENGEMSYQYAAGNKGYFIQPQIENETASKVSLPGTIVMASRETVKVALDLDGNKPHKASCAFAWKPVTGNAFYLMPKAGTKGMVRFAEHGAYAFHSPRTSGTNGAGFENPSKRGLVTEHKKQLNLCPNSIAMISLPGLKVQLDHMMQLQSHQKITMVASGRIQISGQNIVLDTPMQIESSCTNQRNGERNPPTGEGTSLVMKYQFDMLGAQGVLCGYEHIEYVLFEDAPTEGFHQSGLWMNLAMGTFVTIVCLAAAVAVGVFTAGMALGVIALAGAAIGAGISTIAVYKADKESGKVRSTWEALGAVLLGAVSGAVASTALAVVPAAITHPYIYVPAVAIGIKYFGSASMGLAATKAGAFVITGLNAAFTANRLHAQETGEVLIGKSIYETRPDLYNVLQLISGRGTLKILGLGLQNYKNYLDSKGGSGAKKYGIDVENIEFSNTVQNHTGRPYQDSKLLINEIIDSKPPVADPRGTGALSWTVEGTFTGSKGYYELIIDPNSNTVWHFVFKSY